MRRITKLVAGAVVAGAVVATGAGVRAAEEPQRCELAPFSPDAIMIDSNGGNDTIKVGFEASGPASTDCGWLIEYLGEYNLKLVRRGSSDEWKVRGPAKVTVASGDVNNDGVEDTASFTTRATGSAVGGSDDTTELDFVLRGSTADGSEIELHHTARVQGNQIGVDITYGFYEPWPTK